MVCSWECFLSLLPLPALLSRSPMRSSEREERICSLGQRRLFPSPKQGICFAKGEVWALESFCSFSFSFSLFFFFLVVLFFIVMMTYGNYLHRSMLRCTEWECWSPGSIVPDALCKQPAGFAFPSPPPPFLPPSPFSGNVWDKLHQRGRKLCHL